MKTIMKAFAFLLILGPYVLASASSTKIEAGSNWIKGSADATPLRQVLEDFAERVGCDVYIDAALVDEPVTFNIEDKVTPGEAIRRIVRPHSYAVVFGGETEQGEPRILEVWIFRQGEQHTASYVPLKTEGADITHAPVSGEEPDTDASTSPDPSTGSGRTIQGKGLIRRGLTVEKSAFGTPVVKARDRGKGPDYRPSAYQMRLAYERYRLAKHREEQRMAEITLQQARANSERNRRAYHSKRNRELKNHILKLKQR
ncbi:MAG: hypothetical protein ACE5JO_13075 [Candidatus Binatia bacterium]